MHSHSISVHLSSLKLIRKKIVRVITFSDRLAHTAPLFKQLNTLPLDKLIFHRIGLFMYKIHHNMHPSVINEMYVQNHNIYDYNTRQNFSYTSLRDKPTFMLKVSTAQVS